jgi:hypothetical protein
MASKAMLEISRMSDEGLWRRLSGALVLLDPKLIPVTKGERVRRAQAYLEARALVAELKLRGQQLQLFGTSG